jgi:hypothetical protein
MMSIRKGATVSMGNWICDITPSFIGYRYALEDARGMGPTIYEYRGWALTFKGAQRKARRRTEDK